MLSIKRYLALLADKSYRYLWTGQAMSAVGDGMSRIALMLLVHKLTGGSSNSVAILMMLIFLPQIGFSPIAGALADRYDGRRVMQWVDLARAILTILIPFAPSALLIYAIALVQSFLAAMFFAARSRVLRSLVRPEHYLTMSSLAQMTSGAIGMASPALGGLLIARLGITTVFAVDSATFLASVAAITLVSMPHGVAAPSTATAKSARPPLLQELRYGLHELVIRPRLLRLTALFGATSFANGVIAILLVSYTQSTLAGGATALGNLYSLSAVASIGASALLGARSADFREGMAALGGVAFAAGAVALAFSPNQLGLIPIMIIAGAGSTVISVAVPAILMRDAPEKSLGRIMGLFNSAVNIAGLAGYLVAPALELGFGAALGMAVSTIPVWISAAVSGAREQTAGRGNEHDVSNHQAAD